MTLRPAPIGSLLRGDPMKKKAKPVKDEAAKERADHLAFIRTLPCMITGKSPVEAAHVSFTLAIAGKADKGVGKKSDDVYTVPLAPHIHAEQHAHPKGEVGFWAEHGLTKEQLIIVCLKLWIYSGDRAGAMKTIADAQSVMGRKK